MTSRTRIVEIDIVLRGVRPPVRRTVQVPGGMTLSDLHDVVQVAMGWTDSHLHEFDVGGLRYGVPDPDWPDGDLRDDAKAVLSRLVGEGERLDYVYDFGDGWEHRLTVTAVLRPEPGVRYPRCIRGRRACPPEDVGGPGGYEEFCAVMADPAHPDHAERAEWHGGAFDPARFDLAETDAELGPLGWRALTSSAR